MKRRYLLIIRSILLTLLPLLNGCIREEEFDNTPQGNFEALWKIIDEQYCFLDYKQIDWDAIHDKYQPLITPGMSYDGLFEILGNMLAELKDGHVNLYSSSNMARYWDWYLDYPRNFNESIIEKYLGRDYRIAGGAKYDGETWDLIIGKAPTLAALPIVDILTLAATGSEYDAGGVISRTETNDKVAYIDPHLFPACSFLDPTYTFTVNAKHTAAGVADAINHVMEQYFTHASNSVADGFCETLVKTLMKYAPIALEKPDDYEARAEIMYACTFGCNGLLALGTGGSPWPMHGIEHALSGYYDITHGEGLAIITPHWMRHVLNERTQERIVKFGVNVFGLAADQAPSEIAEQTIARTAQFFKSLGMPMTLREVGIDDSRLEEMAHHIAVNEGLDAPGTFAPLNEQDILSILKAAL
mgnify:CR=1 FL=1